VYKDGGVPLLVKPVPVHVGIFFPLGNRQWDAPNVLGRNMAPIRAEMGGVLEARAAAVVANAGKDPTVRRPGPPLSHETRCKLGKEDFEAYLDDMRALQEGAEGQMLAVERALKDQWRLEDARHLPHPDTVKARLGKATGQRHSRSINKLKRLRVLQEEATAEAANATSPQGTELVETAQQSPVYDLTEPPSLPLPIPSFQTPQLPRLGAPSIETPLDETPVDETPGVVCATLPQGTPSLVCTTLPQGTPSFVETAEQSPIFELTGPPSLPPPPVVWFPPMAPHFPEATPSSPPVALPQQA
jgi:hypothetical protein